MTSPMLLARDLGRSLALAMVLLAQAGLSTVIAAPSPTTSSKPEEKAAPGARPSRKDVENGLTLGKSTSNNLIFKSTTEYEQKQNIEALQKLEGIREMHLGSNQWLQVANILQDVLATDTSGTIKSDVKKLALLELAGISEEQGHLQQAQQFLAEYLVRFEADAIIPEVLLRQSYLYRKMGAYERAIDKLYAVFTAAVRLEARNLGYYQRVVLTAKAEIAETYFEQGDYAKAAEFYDRLLKDSSEELNRVVIKAKHIRSLAKIKNNDELIKQAVEFLNVYPTSEFQAEVRYLLATTYKAVGQKQESLRELLLLLEAIDVADDQMAAKWKTWKMLAGNEIGNQLFLEGDWNSAVSVYRGLLNLENTASWKLPLYYQIGLCYEKLLQPEEALKAYRDLVKFGEKEKPKLDSNLQMVIDMANFRVTTLSWRESLAPTSSVPASGKTAQTVAETTGP